MRQTQEIIWNELKSELISAIDYENYGLYTGNVTFTVEVISIPGNNFGLKVTTSNDEKLYTPIKNVISKMTLSDKSMLFNDGIDVHEFSFHVD